MSVVAIPFFIIPMTFLFVLLIVLIAKAPKLGACLVGGLVLLAPIILLRLTHAGGVSEPKALSFLSIPGTFLFVLLIVLMAKSPKVGAALIVAIVVMVILGLFLVPAVSYREVSHSPTGDVVRSQWKEVATEHGVERIHVWDDNPPASGLHGMVPVHPISPTSPPPIWSEGVEQEFEADVYPSGLAAARALGRRMAGPIRMVAGDPNAAVTVVLFQEGNDRSLVSAFGRAMEKDLPNVPYFIEADLRNIRPGEVGVILRVDTAHQMIALVEGATTVISNPQEDTRIVVTALAADGMRRSVEARFIGKPWVESFSSFAGERPDQHFIVARSNGTCTSESQANQQALEDAKARLTEAVGRQTDPAFARLGRPPISTTDVLNGGFIADRFVQSFDTTTGKVWRQALLIDVSGPKLSQLAAVKIYESRQVREGWARMGFSVIGVLVLISVIYFFLNMATRGYYEWSLRIAGVVLAIVAIVSILMLVQ